MRVAMNILVLCTANSARSILLEAILNRLGNGRWRAWSAGSEPAGHVHPQALALLLREGFETAGLRSKSWNEFARPEAPRMDVVITVCGNAASEVCPVWPGGPLKAHWGVDDPASAPAHDQQAAFEDAYRCLRARAMKLAEHRPETLDKTALNTLLTRIGSST